MSRCMACSHIKKHTCRQSLSPQPIHHSTESSQNPANQQPQIPKKSTKSRNSNSSVENKRIDKLPEFGAQFFSPRHVNPRIDKPPDFCAHALGPALMAHDSCRAKAPPPPRLNRNLNLKLCRKIPRNLSLSMQWILGM